MRTVIGSRELCSWELSPGAQRRLERQRPMAPVARAVPRRRRVEHVDAEMARGVEAGLARRRRRRLRVSRRLGRPRLRARTPGSRRARDGPRSRQRQGRVAGEVSVTLQQEPVRAQRGQGAARHAAGHGRHGDYCRRHRHRVGVERADRGARVAERLLPERRPVEALHRDRGVTAARRRIGHRAGRQRRAWRAHHCARSADGRGALDVEGHGTGLRVARRHYRGRRQTDRDHDRGLGRGARREDRRRALVRHRFRTNGTRTLSPRSGPAGTSSYRARGRARTPSRWRRPAGSGR